MKKVLWPQDLETPNDEFFNHKLVENLLESAETKCSLKWDSLTGGTLKERYESFYQKLLKATEESISKGAKGFFWIVCPSDIISFLEISTTNFVAESVSQIPLGYNSIVFMGVLAKRWRIYSDPLLKNKMLMGAGFSKKPSEYYCDIEIENFTY